MFHKKQLDSLLSPLLCPQCRHNTDTGHCWDAQERLCTQDGDCARAAHIIMPSTVASRSHQLKLHPGSHTTSTITLYWHWRKWVLGSQRWWRCWHWWTSRVSCTTRHSTASTLKSWGSCFMVQPWTIWRVHSPLCTVSTRECMERQVGHVTLQCRLMTHGMSRNTCPW